jgi:hypothetical protein
MQKWEKGMHLVIRFWDSLLCWTSKDCFGYDSKYVIIPHSLGGGTGA